MPAIGFHRQTSAFSGPAIFAVSTALAAAVIPATPVFADPLATGSAALAGTAAIAPSGESASIAPGSLDGAQLSRPLPQAQPAAPEEPEEMQPQASGVPGRAPSEAELKLGVPLRCDDPAGFFPHVTACKGAWREIEPATPAAIEPPATAGSNMTAAASTDTQGASDDPLAHARAAGYTSVSDYLSALAAANLEDVRKHDEKDRERRQAANRAKSLQPPEPDKAPQPTKAVAEVPPPHFASPATNVIAEPESAAALAVPQPIKAIAEPQPSALPVAIAAPQPAPAAAEPPRQELAAIGDQTQQRSDRPSKKDANDPDVTWSFSQTMDAATKSLILTARSEQASTNGTALAKVDAACNTGDKQFSLRAALVDSTGGALIPLTERMQLGDADMQSAYFHTELAFNKLVLTRGFDGKAMSDASANTLLAAKRALYEIKTSQGTVAIHVTPADANLHKVLQACQSRD